MNRFNHASDYPRNYQPYQNNFGNINFIRFQNIHPSLIDKPQFNIRPSTCSQCNNYSAGIQNNLQNPPNFVQQSGQQQQHQQQQHIQQQEKYRQQQQQLPQKLQAQGEYNLRIVEVQNNPHFEKSNYQNFEQQNASSYGVQKVSNIRQDAPNYQLKSPNFRQTGPNFRQNSSNYQQISTNFRQTGPNIRQDAPNYQLKSPNFRQNDPNIQQDAPNYQLNIPNFRQNDPNIRQDAPNYQLKSPNFRQNNPNIRQNCSNYQQINTNFQQHGSNFLQNESNYQQNSGNYQQKSPNFQQNGPTLEANRYVSDPARNSQISPSSSEHSLMIVENEDSESETTDFDEDLLVVEFPSKSTQIDNDGNFQFLKRRPPKYGKKTNEDSQSQASSNTTSNESQAEKKRRKPRKLNQIGEKYFPKKFKNIESESISSDISNNKVIRAKIWNFGGEYPSDPNFLVHQRYFMRGGGRTIVEDQFTSNLGNPSNIGQTTGQNASNLGQEISETSSRNQQNPKITKNLPNIMISMQACRTIFENSSNLSSNFGQDEPNKSLKTIITPKTCSNIVENLSKFAKSDQDPSKSSTKNFQNPSKLIKENGEYSSNTNIFENPPNLKMIDQNPRVYSPKSFENVQKISEIYPPEITSILNPENTIYNDNQTESSTIKDIQINVPKPDEISCKFTPFVSTESVNFKHNELPLKINVGNLDYIYSKENLENLESDKPSKEIENSDVEDIVSDSETDSSGSDSDSEFFNLGALLYQDKDFTDIDLLVKDTIFKVHSAVLACQSPFFSTFFKGRKIENGEILKLPDVNPEIFQLIINYIYNGEIQILNNEILLDILELADKFEIKKLTEICKFHLMNMKALDLDPQFGIKLLEIGAKYSDSEYFLNSILQLVKPIYKEIKKLPIWREMVQDPKFFKILQKLVFILDD